MPRLALFVVLCLADTGLLAQQISAGTLLPAMLDNNLESEKSKPGEQISAKLQQEALLPNGRTIKRLSKVLGHVVSTSRAANGKDAAITVQFDKIEIDKQTIPISAGLRAFASMQQVYQAKQPVNPNGGYGTSVWDWNMRLIGGQGAFNGQKIVKDQNGQVVAKIPQPGAVLGIPMPNAERGCGGAPATSPEQAFWVFSTDACGIYDDEKISLVTGIGGTNPGQITFTSPKEITIRGGSGWLLQVN